MLGYLGGYAHWCYSRSDIDRFAPIHDNLVFRFVAAPIGETVLFVGPALLMLFALAAISGRRQAARQYDQRNATQR